MFDTGVTPTCLRDKVGFTRVFRTIFWVFFFVCDTGLIPEFYTRSILVLILFHLALIMLLELIYSFIPIILLELAILHFSLFFISS